MIRSIVLIPVLFLSFLLLSCAPRVVTGPEAKAPETEEKNLQKPAAAQAWEKEWQQTLAAAKREGRLTLYISGGTATVKALTELMKDKFGIEMEYVIGKGGQVGAKVVAERRAGLYLFDMFISGPSTLEILDSVGGLERLESALILPEVKDLSKWWGGELQFVNDRRVALTFVGTVKHPLLYNTDLVKGEELSSYWNLLDSKWKGKLAFYDPTVSGGGNSFFTAVAFKILGIDYFKKLAEQKPAIIQDNRLIVDWVARGKYAVALGCSSEVIVEFRNAGARLHEMTPKEGTYISSSGGNIGFVSKAPHPNAAKVLINFLLSKEGQDIWAFNEGVQSLRLDATVKHLKPEDIRQTGLTYITTDRGELNEAKEKYRLIAKEIFAPLMQDK